MKILMLSSDGDGLGVAHRLAKENHDVDLYIKREGFEKAGVGLVNRVKSFRPLVPKADLIICDMVGFGIYEDLFKRYGKPVFSCNKMADIIELDREKGNDLFKRLKINTPQTLAFETPTDALQMVALWELPGYVIKPSGNQATSRTSIHRDKESFEWALKQLPANTKLIVQQLVEGIEISTEGWFNGRDWIKPFNHTLEEKQLMPGAGPNTGCMGNVVKVQWKPNRLISETVHKLTPYLRKINYRGPVDINSIINGDKLYALEITARMGYDAIEALLEGFKEPVIDLFFETAVGIKKEMKVTDDYMIAVRLSRPPWPHADTDGSAQGMPIIGINDQNSKHLWLTDVYSDETGYRYASGDGVVCKATAIGRSIREARSRVYRTVKAVRFPDKQFRDDIGKRVEGDLGVLRNTGWI